MIDLHMHTTASDGELDPTTLVGQVYAAGIRTFSWCCRSRTSRGRVWNGVVAGH